MGRGRWSGGFLGAAGWEGLCEGKSWCEERVSSCEGLCEEGRF